MNRVWACTILTLSFIAGGSISADEVTISANRDAGFFDVGPDNNMGAWTHVPVGQANNTRINRSVFDFDIASNVPAGATINTVTFEFEVTLQGGDQGQAGVAFDLHRVTRSWLEGTGGENIGEPTGDGVTWLNATDTELWTTPGGDFEATIIGSDFVDGPGDYSISSAQLATDVQNIVDATATNFGFLLKANSDVLGSAARVTSREGEADKMADGTAAARLVIDFSTGVLLGDVNLDGFVTLLDVAPFVQLLTDGEFQAEADINQDGFVTLLDVEPFVALLGG